MQAQKFSGVQDPMAVEIINKIQRARSPEEAARFGRSLARERPDLVGHMFFSFDFVLSHSHNFRLLKGSHMSKCLFCSQIAKWLV